MRKPLMLFLFMLCSIFSRAQFTGRKCVIYFPFGESIITDEAKREINSILQTNRELIDSIRIDAYCDSIGSDKANDLLSLRRCNAVKVFLKGVVDTSLIKTVAFGKHDPLNDNSTEALRALNRRAEIIFYEKPFVYVIPNTPAKTASFADTIKEGGKFTLRNLNFYGSRHFLLPASLPVLDTLANILKDHPSMEIEIQGYVCCIAKGYDGTDMDNGDPKLSVARAKTVYDYLIDKGIDSTRLSYKGFGSKPLLPENTEEGRKANRRVEIKVVKK